MTSTIKVDNIQKTSDSSNIIKKCGSTITLGSCGASIALATGMIRNVNSKNNLNFIKQRLFVFILCNINNKCVKSYDKRKTSTQQ